MKLTTLEVITLDTVLQHFRGNQSKAAAFLNINRLTLKRIIGEKRPLFVVPNEDGTYTTVK